MQFQCRVGTPDGRVLDEIYQASDETTLRGDLERRGYHLFEVRLRGLPRRLQLPRFGRRGRRISQEEFLVFNQELAALLRAGLPLLQALDLMLERMSGSGFRAILTDVRDRVKSGTDLSDAFAAYGDTFPRLYPSALKAGEKSGEIEKVIRRFIRYQKLVIDARKRVISALIYPAVLIGLSVVMIAIMTTFVVPKFSLFFQSMNIKLPLATRIILGVSSFTVAKTLGIWNWVWVALAVATGVFAVRSWSEAEAGRSALDRAKLRLPLIGSVLHRFALSEFCRSLATLLAGGIPLVPAFEIAASSVGNAFVRGRLEPTIQLVREGVAFHQALERSEVFVDIAVDMVKVGESTGSLDEMLSSVSDFFDDQIETRMARILSLIEPLMLVLMGIIVAILLISIYLPLFGSLGRSDI